MPTIQMANIESAVPAVLKKIDRLKVTDVAYKLQDYPLSRRLLKKHQVQIGSGEGIQWQLKVNKLDTAENVGFYQAGDTSTGDMCIKGTVSWRQSRNHWIYDIGEIAECSGPERILDLVKLRRTEAYQNLWELVERDGWGKPASSADEVTPYGLQMWIVKSSSTEGFYGANPDGFAAGVGNIDADTYTEHRNWQAEYVNVSQTDLIDKMKRAAYKTSFRALVPIPDRTLIESTNREWYSNYLTTSLMESLAVEQNDRNGHDLDSAHGRMRFQGNPILPVPYLDSDDYGEDETRSSLASKNPIYGVNWDSLKFHVFKGWNVLEMPPEKAAHQPTVRECWIYFKWQLVCRNRRNQIIIAQA